MPVAVSGRSRVLTRFGEVQVATAVGGSRELLVITPIGSAWMEHALPEALQELFTIHVVELPGTGNAEPQPEAASVAAVAAATSDVAVALDLSEPVLFGHSMNGTLALTAAAGMSCRGVVAVAPSAELPPRADVAVAYWEAHAEWGRRR